MSKISKMLGWLNMVAAVVLLSPLASHAQQADKPTYKDGDWWKVKVEVSVGGGYSASRRCYDKFPEYVVKIEEGAPVTYAVNGSNLIKMDCFPIRNELLGISQENSLEFLQFPLTVGKTWQSKTARDTLGGQKWADVEYQVLSWEKIATPKEDFEALKIKAGYQITVGGKNAREAIAVDISYYYSPKAKAVVAYESKSDIMVRKVLLVDYQVAE